MYVCASALAQATKDLMCEAVQDYEAFCGFVRKAAWDPEINRDGRNFSGVVGPRANQMTLVDYLNVDACPSSMAPSSAPSSETQVQQQQQQQQQLSDQVVGSGVEVGDGLGGTVGTRRGAGTEAKDTSSYVSGGSFPAAAAVDGAPSGVPSSGPPYAFGTASPSAGGGSAGFSGSSGSSSGSGSDEMNYASSMGDRDIASSMGDRDIASSSSKVKCCPRC